MTLAGRRQTATYRHIAAYTVATNRPSGVHAAAASGLVLKKPELPCLKMYYSELMGIPSFVSQVFDNERNHHGLPDEAGFISLAANGE